MSQLGGASDGLQKDHPDIRHLRRLYERGQCRSVGQPTEAAHRLDRHREDHPRLEHLAVFVRLLSRSALGPAITQYTSHFRGTRAGGEMHVVLVDNRLGMAQFWTSLKCIRCGA